MNMKNLRKVAALLLAFALLLSTGATTIFAKEGPDVPEEKAEKTLYTLRIKEVDKEGNSISFLHVVEGLTADEVNAKTDELVPENHEIVGTEVSEDGKTITVSVREVEETPETPEKPENPETPEKPENPETPEKPENPETPEVPGVSEKSKTPEVNKVTEGDKKITGKGEPGSDIIVELPDGTKLEGKVDKDGNWSVELPKDKKLNKGDKIVVVQRENGKEANRVEITVAGKDGQKTEAKPGKKPGKTSPKTGDSGVMLTSAVALLAAAALVITKREKKVS